VIPEAAVLIVRNDDDRVLPVRSVPDRVDQVFGVQLAAQNVGVSGVLVYFTERLDERDGREVSVLGGGEEFRLVAQVLRLRGGAVGVVREVGERLMVKLKKGIRVPCERVVPTT
jgi:hypothetical protein